MESGSLRSPCPECERGCVFDEHPVTRHGRCGPRGAVGDGIALHRVETAGARPGHDQLGIVLQQEHDVAGAKNRGVGRLAWRAGPQRLPGPGVEREELTAVPV